jgi:GNAT superfamily N-acetyltransferase
MAAVPIESQSPGCCAASQPRVQSDSARLHSDSVARSEAMPIEPGQTAATRGEDPRTREPRTDDVQPGDVQLDDVQIVELLPSTPAPTLDAARRLLLEYGRFVVAQPGAARFCFGTLREEAEGLPLSFIHQGGGSLLAFVRGEPAGFVAWRALAAPQPASIAVPGSAAPEANSSAWELKRLWVHPSARGFALGRRLTQAVLDRACAAGRKAVYLDTAPSSMAAAHRLYGEMGFVPCAAYNDNPVEGLVWMVKFL